MADEKAPEDTGSGADAPSEQSDPEQEFWNTDPGDLADMQRGGKGAEVTKDVPSQSLHELREQAKEQSGE
jgi:hypothetical protein